MAVERATSQLTESLGQTPSAHQVAAHLEMAVEDVLEALEVRESQKSVSLDMPHSSDGLEASSTLGDSIGKTEQGFDRVESQMAVEACARVSPREREVIELRFSEDLNQYEIGDRLGISQMQVSRTLRRGLAKMLEATQGDEIPNGRRSLESTAPDARFPDGRIKARAGSTGRAA